MTDLTPETLAEWRKDAEAHFHAKEGLSFDWCDYCVRLALLDALAAEKAARPMPWTLCTGADDCPEKWHEHGCYADHGQCSEPTEHHGWADYEREKAARKEACIDAANIQTKWLAAEARADKAEQECDELEARLAGSQAAYDDLARETGVALDKAWSAKNAAEARVAELEVEVQRLRDGITALCDWLEKGPHQPGTIARFRALLAPQVQDKPDQEEE